MGKPFIVRNVKGDTAYLAAFNLDSNSDAVHDSVALSKVACKKAQSYIVYEYFSKKAYIADAAHELEFELKSTHDFKLISLTPVCSEITFLGLCDKMIASGSVTVTSGCSCVVSGAGTLAFYSKSAVTSVTVCGRDTAFESSGGLYFVTVPSGAEITVQ